ncbi:UDP-N-acetylglucosamine1-carboxyvinyltransferase [Striga asiatica]|uniref:UDP-N-acetylglucosamine1-carboxyvinyltransferase n=1 Tax=Striga asiatica TaxID=4170 RepID=A0A5A7QLA0_STRAF|nr:UDP-N-acetylglucosamine1-carboxyvinyltransferase [Striga asiatica]
MKTPSCDRAREEEEEYGKGDDELGTGRPKELCRPFDMSLKTSVEIFGSVMAEFGFVGDESPGSVETADPTAEGMNRRMETTMVGNVHQVSVGSICSGSVADSSWSGPVGTGRGLVLVACCVSLAGRVGRDVLGSRSRPCAGACRAALLGRGRQDERGVQVTRTS